MTDPLPSHWRNSYVTSTHDDRVATDNCFCISFDCVDLTPEEYRLQQYEGASTELGPNEMTGMLYLLQNVKFVEQKEFVESQTFKPGVRRNPAFGPDLLLLRVPRNMIDDDLQPLYPLRLKRLESRIPRFEWHEDPNDEDQPEKRRVSIFSEQTIVADDRKSSDLLTVFDGNRMEKTQKKRAYVGVWVPPDGTSTTQYFYFRVQTGNGLTVCSKKFTLGTLKDVAPPKPIDLGECPLH